MTKINDDHQLEEEFAEWLGDALRRSGLDLSDAAQKAGISQSYMSMLRSRERENPTPETVQKIAGALDADRDRGLAAAARQKERSSEIRKRSAHKAASTFELQVQSRWCLLQFCIEEHDKRRRDYSMKLEIKSALAEGPSDKRSRTIGIGESLAIKPPSMESSVNIELIESSGKLAITIPLELLRSGGRRSAE